jgi:alkanesulfonate monooxygenase SsuD/methylene tetrahydromethanopterin reductase-like flavin-dependent oxidoreductase (luciferase family)
MVLGAAQWWPGGDHITAWRRPGAQPEAFLDLEYYVDWARTAERGTFDTSFLASASDEEARNFGRERNVDHATRYERGRECVDAVRGLWDSWDDNALVHEKVGGRFADPAKLRTLDHRGKHFTVRGPLNIARPPRGCPVLFQAGASEAGRDLAAATADTVFTLTGPVGRIRDFNADVRTSR